MRIAMYDQDPFDVDRLMQSAAQLQLDVERARGELLASSVQGRAGGGAVTVTVSGSGEIESLQISPLVADPDQTEALVELILSAVQDAHAALASALKEQLHPMLDALRSGLDDLS